MKKIVAVLVIVASLLIVPFKGVSASHINPNNNLPCTNTNYRYEHFYAPVSHWTTTHFVGTGVCTINTFVYDHNKYCTSCPAYLGMGATYECTENHTNSGCGNSSRCTGLNPTP